MEEPHDASGKWMLIAHAVCCGGPLLLILIASNAAFLLSLVRSGAFWAGLAVLLGGAVFFLIRRRLSCQTRPPADDNQPLRYPLGAGFHE